MLAPLCRAANRGKLRTAFGAGPPRSKRTSTDDVIALNVFTLYRAAV